MLGYFDARSIPCNEIELRLRNNGQEYQKLTVIQTHYFRLETFEGEICVIEMYN